LCGKQVSPTFLRNTRHTRHKIFDVPEEFAVAVRPGTVMCLADNAWEKREISPEVVQRVRAHVAALDKRQTGNF
jgi:hypothetical protein